MILTSPRCCRVIRQELGAQESRRAVQVGWEPSLQSQSKGLRTWGPCILISSLKSADSRPTRSLCFSLSWKAIKWLMSQLLQSGRRRSLLPKPFVLFESSTYGMRPTTLGNSISLFSLPIHWINEFHLEIPFQISESCLTKCLSTLWQVQLTCKINHYKTQGENFPVWNLSYAQSKVFWILADCPSHLSSATYLFREGWSR